MALYLSVLSDMDIKGRFRTDLSLSPQKSQVFVLGCLLVSAFCLFSSFAFLWVGKDKWEVPLICSAVAGGLAFVGWLFSHRNVDLSGGRTTELFADDRGLSIRMDARNHPTKQMLMAFASYAESAAHREKLPKSSGLIDSSGKVIEGSELEANQEIDRLNALVESQAEQMKTIAQNAKDGAINLTAEIAAPSYTGTILAKGIEDAGS